MYAPLNLNVQCPLASFDYLFALMAKRSKRIFRSGHWSVMSGPLSHRIQKKRYASLWHYSYENHQVGVAQAGGCGGFSLLQMPHAPVQRSQTLFCFFFRFNEVHCYFYTESNGAMNKESSKRKNSSSHKKRNTHRHSTQRSSAAHTHLIRSILIKCKLEEPKRKINHKIFRMRAR